MWVVIYEDLRWLYLLISVQTGVHSLLLGGYKQSYSDIFRKTTMAVNNFGTSCSKQRLILWYFRDNYKKQSREGRINQLPAHQQSVQWPWILHQPPTKKRSGVNRWLLLYVYVSHTGYSKIGLALACQLHAQRQPVLLRQALFGPTLVRNSLRASDPFEKTCPQGLGWSVVERRSSWVPALGAEGGGFNPCDVFTQCGVQKKNNNMMWLRRFCTCRLPICACLSPFLHIRPFSDVLLNTNSIYVKVMWQQSYFQCISDDTLNVCAFLNTKESWFLRSKEINIRGKGPKQNDSPKRIKMPSTLDLIITSSVSLKTWGKKRRIFRLILFLC